MNQKNWRWWRNKAINLQQTRQYLKEKLAMGGCDSPGQTSLLLLQHALKQPKSWVLSHSEYEPTPEEHQVLHKNAKQYLQGMPLPYILGSWEFFGRTFQVTPDVLIPRPETEDLVELALEHARHLESPLIVDVGTGSGCIAISLAAELPTATVLGIDLSMAALRVAHQNARHLGQSRVRFLQSDLLTSFSAQFDLICANLPYIPSQTLTTLPVSRWEPRLALDGGKTGLEAIQRLLNQAQSRLAPNGVILLETETTLGNKTLVAAQEYFPHAHLRLIRDLAGLDRIVEIRQENKTASKNNEIKDT
jgi:release factor glutamine methyltransferase